MYTQYLKPALRRITGNKLYSLISILTLAIGMAACILIAGFIRYERGFDGMHHGGEHIYRLNWSVPATGSRFATFYNPMSPLLAEGMAEVEAFTRLGLEEHNVEAAGAEYRLTISLVDDDFFRFFNYPAMRGEPDAAIRDQGAAVLTEAAALRVFGRLDVVGEVLTVDGTRDFRVGAVVANNPANSHLGSNIFLNIENLPALRNAPDFWTRAGYIGSDVLYHYVRLAPDAEPTATGTAMEDYIRRLFVPDYDHRVHLQPLRDIHFNPDLQNELPMADDLLGTVKPLRKKSDLLVFGTIGVLALGIAALNFMNMQAVQFTRRIREVGIRRINGASYLSLTLQLLIETVLIALFALALAVPLCELLTPYFHAMLGIPAGEGEFLDAPFVAAMALAACVLGVGVGLYPALGAARRAPVFALRNEPFEGGSAAALRSVLIVLQFTISIGLIAGSFTAKSQIDYALSSSLGFDPRNVVRVELPDEGAAAVYGVMRNALLSMPSVAAVSAATGIPTRSLSDGAGFVPESGDTDDMLLVRTVSVSEGYFDALGMPVVEGRALSEDFASDRKPTLSAEAPYAVGGMMLNETAARLAGWTDPAEAVGRHFYTGVEADDSLWINDYTVVGVVADADFGSLRRGVEPVAFLFPQSYQPSDMLVRLTGADAGAVLATLDRLWREQVPGQAIRRSFLADDHAALYAGEQRTFTLFIALSSLAVLIACSGLYALASYIVERRVKEVGVRKVLGGSVWSIVLLLTNDFSKLVLVSNVIAWPVAWFAMDRWLSNFAYRIDLTPLIFVGSGAIALCIAWVTVGGTAAKAASARPVLALRYE